MIKKRKLLLCIGLLCLGFVGYSQQAILPVVEAESGDFYGADSNYGIILTSSNGTCYRLRVVDDGSIITENVACPNDPQVNENAEIVCPNANFVLTDPTQFTVNVVHDNPISQVVNYDPRIDGKDPGASIVYNPNNAVHSRTYDISSKLPGSGTGTFDLEVLYWYDGDFNVKLSAGTCVVNYNF